MTDAQGVLIGSDPPVAANGKADEVGRGWPRPAFWLTATTALALGLLLIYKGVRLGVFQGQNEIDDGLYYGEGVLLSHGLLPYRSYIDVQPPGIALLMAPFALLGRVTDNRIGFEVARIFFVIVGVVNVGLLGRLVRRRHWVGVLVCLVTFAFFVDTRTADHTILLESLLVLGTLLGFLTVFGDTEIATSSATRWLTAGVLLGLTTSFKLWGVFPMIVLLVFAASRGRRCLAHFVGGGIGGFGVVCLPFFLLAPAKFVREVIVTQATRSHLGFVSEKFRLMNLLGGTAQVRFAPSIWVPVALWVILALVILGSILYARRVDPNRTFTNLDACAMACVVVVGASFLLAPEFQSHYGGFFTPFLALVLSATAVRLLPLARPLLTVAIVVAMLGFFLMSAHDIVDKQKEPLPTAALDRLFPPSACVISEAYAPVILANRYNLYRSQCPRILDVDGAELTDGNGSSHSASDATDQKVQSDWLGWLHRADGLVLLAPVSKQVDIGTAVRTYLHTHFSLAAVSDGLFIYRRV